MKQQSNGPSQVERPISERSVWFFLLPVSSLLVIFTGMLVGYLPQVVQIIQSGHFQISQPKVSQETPLPRSLIYEQAGQLWIISAWNGRPQLLATPGYRSRRGVSPLVTPSGQLVYSGDGIWLSDPSLGHPQRIASLPADQVITSMAVSRDGSQLAWSSAPLADQGSIALYAGPLRATKLIYQQSTTIYPSFQIFSVLDTSPSGEDQTLLLTDDHGDHGAVQHGLWIMRVHQGRAEQPQQVLASDPPQGPLALSPDGSHLLSTTWEGYVPTPQDGSLPVDAQALSYANNLQLATLDVQEAKLDNNQFIVQGQSLPPPEAMTTPSYQWLMPPRFSPDGNMLAYIQFSSNNFHYFIRKSEVYTVTIKYSGTQVMLGSPQYVASGNAGYYELGDWLDKQYLTLYGNGSLYTLNVENNDVKRIIVTKRYAQIIGVVTRE